MILRGIFWCITLAGAVVICLYGVEESHYAVDELNDVFMGLIYNWDTDPRAARVMKMIQVKSQCSVVTTVSYTHLTLPTKA